MLLVLQHALSTMWLSLYLQEQDKRTVALRKLNAELLNDQRIIFSIVPIGDGMALCTKL